MGKFTILIFLVSLAGCGEKVTKVSTNKKYIERNMSRLTLLEASDKLQNLRLDALESSVSGLELRVAANEDAIDANESDILDLFDLVADLGQELDSLRSDLRSEVRELKRADRQLRRLIRSKVRSLRQRLAREVRQRQLADSQLQGNIDDIESHLNRFEARQRAINYFLSRAIAATNYRISQLQSRVSRDISRIDANLDAIEADVAAIESEVAGIQSQLVSIGGEIDAIEDKLIEVVYPCGEGSSEEVLLKTEDGLVAYFQRMETEILNFSDSITIAAYNVPGHYDRYCVDTNFFNGECSEFETRFVAGSTIAAKTYNVGDSASIKVLKHAYLDVLGDGNYGTTDGSSCSFSIVNGELVGQGV